MSDGVAPTKNTKNMQVESYQRIRSAIGALAVLLPIVLFLSTGLESVQFVPSISEFYYTPAREILVGTIGAIAVFLISYKGYSINVDRAVNDWQERWLTDRRVSYWAAFGALGVAFFPTKTKIDMFLDPEPLVYSALSYECAGLLHQMSAVLFFGALAIFCSSNFRRGEKNTADDKKENDFYKWCGRVLFACIVALGAIAVIISNENTKHLAVLLDDANVIFWVETIGLFTFAAAWLRKGDAKKTIPDAVRQFFGR